MRLLLSLFFVVFVVVALPAADEAKLVFKTNLVDISRNRPTPVKEVFYTNGRATGDDPVGPDFFVTGNKLGLVDYYTEYISWLGDDFKITNRTKLSTGVYDHPYGQEQGDGLTCNPVEPTGVYYFNRDGQLEKWFISTFRSRGSFREGLWYQANCLFFYDKSYNLMVVQNPKNTRLDPAARITDNDVGDASEAINLISQNKNNQFKGLSYSDDFGLMHNGFPIDTIYSDHWHKFFEFQKLSSNQTVDVNRQEPIYKDLIGSRLVKVTKDGLAFFYRAADGAKVSLLVIKNGLVIKNIDILKSHKFASLETTRFYKIRENGDIYMGTQSDVDSGAKANPDGFFAIYEIKRSTWDPEYKKSIGRGVLNDSAVRLRQSPNTDAVILTKLDKGVVFDILDKTQTTQTIDGKTAPWYQIRLSNGTIGWIFGSFVDVKK